jgi:hypothetical protein
VPLATLRQPGGFDGLGRVGVVVAPKEQLAHTEEGSNGS